LQAKASADDGDIDRARRRRVEGPMKRDEHLVLRELAGEAAEIAAW
jgi:ribosomal protein S28E/S33